MFHKTLRILRPQPLSIKSLDEEYRSDDGWTMCREQGKTPNGNDLRGDWVLRDDKGQWVDFDRYRSDLAARYGFEIDFTH